MNFEALIKSVFSVLFAAVGGFLAYGELRALQMNNYRTALRERTDLKEAAGKSVIFGLLYIFCSALAKVNPISGGIASIGISIAAIIYFVVKIYTERTKFKTTARGTRLLVLSMLAIVGMVTAITALHDTPFELFMSNGCFLILVKPLVSAVNAIVRPFENLNIKRYVKNASNKIASLNAIKIAITGSFGKTSVKNVISAVLSKKYKVICTEKNYNTPTGLALSSQKIEGDEQVFIAEFGAKRKGDIKELANIVKPDIAVITGITEQHLASFRTIDNVYATKKELIDALSPDGYAVFNGENKFSSQMSNEWQYGKCVVGLSADFPLYAKNVKMSNTGSKFTIVSAEEEFQVETALLGKHNILNILLAVAVGLKLNVPTEAIAEAIKELKPFPHRLELIKNDRNITIIDDSYNANPEGVRFALEVLSLFEGRKVVFTQGIVELGKKQKELNRALGTLVSQTAEICILTGINAKSIEEGLLEGGFQQQNIYKLNSFSEAEGLFHTLLCAGDVLLIQNDIP